MSVDSPKDNLEILLRPFEDCHRSFIKLQKNATEKESIFLLSKFSKVISSNKTDSKQIIKTLYFIFERISLFQEKGVKFLTSDIEKCFVTILHSLSNSHKIDGTTFELFIAIIKQIHKFIDFHAKSADNISENIFTLCSHIFSILWKYINSINLEPILLVEVRIRSLNLFIFPPQYFISRYFTLHMHNLYKSHLTMDITEEDQTKISSILVTQSLKWLKIPQFNSETVLSLIKSKNNFYSLVIVLITIAFGTKDTPISGKIILKCFLQELSNMQNIPPLLTIGIAISIIRIYTFENLEFPSGMLEKIDDILNSVLEEDLADFYPHFYQIIPILLKEIGVYIEKQKNSQIFLCYKSILRIIEIFTRELFRKYQGFCQVFPDEIEFHISVPLNIMRNAFQHFSKLEFCSEDHIHGWINTFSSFYRIFTKVRPKEIKFKTQNFDVYVTASLVRIHHIAVLANKHNNPDGALEFLINSIEMTSVILEPIKFESLPEVLFLLELLTNFLINSPGKLSNDLTKRTKDIIKLFSLEFYLSTAERNAKILRNWIRILFLQNRDFEETLFQIFDLKYNLNSKQKVQIIDIEHEILLTISTPLNPKLLDIILNKYSTKKASFQDSISQNPVGPLLKISYLYDCGEWDLALEQIIEILSQIQEIFETKISLESIQTYSLAKFWSALLTYQISNKTLLHLAPNYPQISSECDSVHIPNIPHGFLVAMEYIYILLRYFKREISSFFIKELEFALKTLLFIFNLFSNQFYLVLTFICSSIYLSEFCTNNLDFAVQTLNDFSEFLIENGYQNTFQSLQEIYELQNGDFQYSDDRNNENILRYSKREILAQFLNKSTCNTSNAKLKSHISSNSLKLLIESEFEYFALKNTDTISTNQILIYTHSHLITLCNTFRKYAANVLTNSFSENTHFSDKRIPFSILPSFLQRVYRISQILIQSGSTQDATTYIDLGFQISGKLNLFEWRLQFLMLGIQLDVVRQKIERIEEYSVFITKMRDVLSETDRSSSEEEFDGFSHLLKLKKLKLNRGEFKDFCCLTRNFGVIPNQQILQNFNEILRLTSKQILEINSQSLTKTDYKIFHENIQEILTNFHIYFHRIKSPEIPLQVLKISQFPPNEHLLYLKIYQIQSLTNQIRESNTLKSALSVYKIATKLIIGMQNNNSIFMAQPYFCQILSEFYLQAGKSLSKDSEICDHPKCCLFDPKFEIAKDLHEIYTNCIQSTIPYGSVLALKYSLSSLGELFSQSDPILSSAYFNVAFGISLRHLFLNKHSVSKSDYFDLFCFDSVTHNPQNCLKDNFLSSLTNLQPNWTILTISWPKKGDNLFITRLRNGRPPILFKIPILQLAPPKFDSKNWHQNKNELKSLEEILASIFDLLHEANKPDNIVNKSKWWLSRTKANTALSETLTQIELEWFSSWKGIFLGKISISQDFVSTSVKELIEFIETIVKIPPFQYEICTELFGLILESYPLLKRTQMELILPQIFPDLEQNNCKIISKKIAIVSEELYEKIADFLDKFECTPQSVPRGHIFLILDPHLHRIPWENLPILSTQSVSRVPSLHFLFMLTQKYSPHSNIDLTNGFYVLNPQGDLLKCENDFQKLFRSLKWHGVAGQPPEGLIDSVSKHDLYVYCGHGSGSEYINKDKLLNIKGKAFTMLMGCSTSRLSIEGPYEYPNMLLLLLLAGFPTIIGTLWFVTDSEINLFTKKLIQEIVKNKDLRFSQGLDRANTLSIAFHQARLSCKLRYITGAAPIIYGLPLY